MRGALAGRSSRCPRNDTEEWRTPLAQGDPKSNFALSRISVCTPQSLRVILRLPMIRLPAQSSSWPAHEDRMNGIWRTLSRFTKWLCGFDAGGRQSSGAVPLVLDDGSMSDHLRGPPIPTPLELLVGFAGIFRRSPKGPPPPAELDEHGLPREWRRNDPVDAPFYRRILARSEEHWRVFESWCESRSLQAFPAIPEIVLGFLLDPPVRGRALHDAWMSIGDRHEAHYWHDDACPWCALRRNYGVDVGSDGESRYPMRFWSTSICRFSKQTAPPLARKSAQYTTCTTTTSWRYLRGPGPSSRSGARSARAQRSPPRRRLCSDFSSSAQSGGRRSMASRSQ